MQIGYCRKKLRAYYSTQFLVVSEAPKDSKSPSEEELPEKVGFIAELKRRNVFRVAAAYAVAAWIIIQVASTTFEGFGIPEWAFRFVVIMLALGFPVAIIIAWAFELTPDGVKTTKAARRDMADIEVSDAENKKLNRVTILFAATLPTLVFGAIALFFYFQAKPIDSDYSEQSPVEQIEEVSVAIGKSIAVLPFTNRSELKSDEFFTDGIHDDLLTQISRIRDIKTISRTSVLAYKGTTKNMKQIGEELGVATLLEGGVQRSGNQIRINIQLIDANTDAHLWAETYTREMTAENVFAIQSEITEAITVALKAVLSPEEEQQIDKLPTQNLEALEAYFLAKSHMAKPSSQGFLNAIPLLLNAIELDPDYADAHALLANAYISRIYYGSESVDEQLAKARPHIDRALELNEFNEDALVQQGFMYRYLKEFDKSKKSLLRAIEINPNYSAAHQGLGLLMLWGYYDVFASIEHFKRAVELDPLSFHAKSQLAEALMNIGAKDEALAIMKELVEKEPSSALYQQTLAKVYQGNFKRFALAIKIYRLAYVLDPENSQVMQNISDCYFSLGDKEAAVWWLERLLKLMPNQVFAPELQAWVYSLNGDDVRALEAFRGLEPESAWRVSSLYWLAENETTGVAKKAARKEFSQIFPDFDKAKPVIMGSLGWALNYAILLNGTGDGEDKRQAKRIADAFVELGKDFPGADQFYMEETMVYLILEDQELALLAFEKFVENGGLWSRSHFNFSGNIAANTIAKYLEGNPEYERLATIGIGNAQKQLDQIAAWEAAGELAPLPEAAK